MQMMKYPAKWNRRLPSAEERQKEELYRDSNKITSGAIQQFAKGTMDPADVVAGLLHVTIAPPRSALAKMVQYCGDKVIAKMVIQEMSAQPLSYDDEKNWAFYYLSLVYHRQPGYLDLLQLLLESPVRRTFLLDVIN